MPTTPRTHVKTNTSKYVMQTLSEVNLFYITCEISSATHDSVKQQLKCLTVK